MDCVAHQAPLSTGFPRRTYRGGLPFPPSGHLSDPGIKPVSRASPVLAGRIFTTDQPAGLYPVDTSSILPTPNHDTHIHTHTHAHECLRTLQSVAESKVTPIGIHTSSFLSCYLSSISLEQCVSSSVSVFRHAYPYLKVYIWVSYDIYSHPLWKGKLRYVSQQINCSNNVLFHFGFPDSSVSKESACNARDPGLITGSGRSAGEGVGYPLQYSWASLVVQLVKNLPAM